MVWSRDPRGVGHIHSRNFHITWVTPHYVRNTQFGLGLLYIAVALIWYAAGWWQGRTVERDRWEERVAGQDQLVQRDQQGQGREVLVRRQPSSALVTPTW